MKKSVLIALIPALLLIVSCNNKKQEIDRLKQKNDSLLTIGFKQDTTLLEYVKAFNDIQANLDSIKQKENIISQNARGGEIQPKAQDQINGDINAIYLLLQKNREIVASLRTKLKKSDARVLDLEKMIANLNKQVEDKNAQIEELRGELAKLNIKITDLSAEVGNLNQAVTDLNADNQVKQQTIDEKTAQLHTAWYVIGTTKELKTKKIITEQGGLIGIGKSKTVSPDFDKTYFTKVDITNLKELPIYKKEVRILTAHPASSYKMPKDPKKGYDKLEILNYTDFWSASKYLVIVAD